MHYMTKRKEDDSIVLEKRHGVKRTVKLCYHLLVVFAKGVVVTRTLHRLLTEHLEVLEKEVSQREQRRVSLDLQHEENRKQNEVGGCRRREMSLDEIELDKKVERTKLGMCRHLLTEGREKTVCTLLKRDGQLDSRFLYVRFLEEEYDVDGSDEGIGLHRIPK